MNELVDTHLRRTMRLPWTTFLLLPCIALLTGCLTVETKEYHITMRDNRSGEARIVFCDIQSEADDTVDVTGEDFALLINNFFSGSRLEKENPGFRNIEKHLYERDGKLYGEIRFQFDSLSVLRLFQFDQESPYMYFVGSPLSAEVLMETNGKYGGVGMPVVFWSRDTRELYFKTRIVSQAPYHKSLLAQFTRWEAAGRPALVAQ